MSGSKMNTMFFDKVDQVRSILNLRLKIIKHEMDSVGIYTGKITDDLNNAITMLEQILSKKDDMVSDSEKERIWKEAYLAAVRSNKIHPDIYADNFLNDFNRRFRSSDGAQ